MKKIILPLLMFCFTLTSQINAQHILCGYDHAVQKMEEKYPGFKAAADQTFANAQAHSQHADASRADMTYKIPVVIHVVWKEAEENIADSLVQSQIDVLNEDFRRLNADAGNIRPIFEDVVGDANIEFELVSIERVETAAEFSLTLTGLPDNVKVSADGGSDAWDTETHLNIWVCKIQPISIIGIELGQILGYAYPPAGLANWPDGANAPSPELDGVVIDYRVFGRNSPFELDLGTGPLVTKGRTPTHEVGHYLGLRHVWGDGGGLLGGDSCMDDDGVTDTPNSGSQANFDCDPTRNTCIDATDDLPDMIENFLDYSSETCMNSFTEGQIEVMRGVLENERCMLVDACSVLSTNALDLSDKFRVFPNPTQGELHFETGITNIQDFDVKLFTLSGQEVKNIAELTDNTLNVRNLENGLYILKLQKENMQIIKKVSLIK